MGFSGVEEGEDPVAAEPAEPEHDPFDALDEIVGCFRRSARYVGLVPRGDLILPSDDGSTQRLDLARTRIVLESPANTLDVLDGEIGIRVDVDLTSDSFGMPRYLALTVRAADGFRQPSYSRASPTGT